MTWTVIKGDCLDVLAELADNSVDAIVQDPPAGIGFMGKSWDRFKAGRDEFIAWMEARARQEFRVLKPGGYSLTWGIPRTVHWTAYALENAGFMIDDTIAHLFGQGFPKSHNIAKAIEKQAGVQPIGEKPPSLGMANNPQWNTLKRQLVMPDLTVGAAWEGWGTALKPAREDWILAQKPISESTIAKNVLRWGTGGINIDGCRIEYVDEADKASAHPGSCTSKKGALAGGTQHDGSRSTFEFAQKHGRWPANVVFDEEAAAVLDEQSGFRGCDGRGTPGGILPAGFMGGDKPRDSRPCGPLYNDEGGASRFFYVAKAARSEKEAGCAHLPKKTAAELTKRKPGSAGLVAKHADGSDKANPYAGTSGAEPRANHHPTVKPIDLMRYLVRMITPPGGIVLDPFCGSGTTGVATLLEGFEFWGIEKDEDDEGNCLGYIAIAEARLAHVEKHGAAA